MEGMQFRGVSWLTDAGKATRRAAVAASLLGVGALGLPAADAKPSDNVTVIVQVEDGSRAARLFAAVGGRLQDGWDGHTMRAVVPRSAVDRIRDVPGVIEVTVEDMITFPAADPSAVERPTDEPGFVEGDHGHNEGGLSYAAATQDVIAEIINTDRARRRTDGSGVDVALIDTGVAPVDGVGTVINGPDLSFDAGNPEMTHLDAYGHGTFLAGIINGDSDAAPGIAPGARVVNVRVGAADGAVDVSQVIAAIDWTVQHRNDNGLNVRVMVLAYGTDSVQPYEIDPLAAAVENAWRNGIVVVAAAGNRGQGATSLDNPALDPFVIAVGASETNGTYSTADDAVAPFTNGGSTTRNIDVLAPGRSLVGLRVPGGFADTEHPEGRVGPDLFRGSGTSQAAAVTGAAAALLIADRPTLTPDQVKYLLESTARRLRYQDGDHRQGAGTIDVSRAMNARTPRDSVATQTFTPSSGTGSLEAARGTYHVATPDSTVIQGEYTVWGAWNGTSWSGTSWSGTSWSGTSWSGTSWSGTSWSGQSWSGTSWSGGSWSGTSWSGTSWSGGTWLGTSWSGTSWSGQSWSGQSWSGNSWRGTSWSGTSWSGTSWSGNSWRGTSWSGTSWSGLNETVRPPTTTTTTPTPTTQPASPSDAAPGANGNGTVIGNAEPPAQNGPPQEADLTFEEIDQAATDTPPPAEPTDPAPAEVPAG